MSEPREHHPDDDRGAVIMVVAILMLLILSMAAFAIDVGERYDTRREVQAAVDIGLLSGSQDVPFGTDQASELIASEIRRNLDLEFTNSEWTALWATSNCSDADAYDITGVVLSAPTNCISFDDTGRARVRLPDIEIQTTFASLFGVDSMTVAAEAEAFVRFAGIGGVLPFTVLGGAEDGSQICLRSSSGGAAIPPCEGSQSGNFHALQISIYGDDDFKTDTIPCNTNDNDVFTINVAVGIDHLLRVKTDDSPGITDSCAKPFGPNQFYTDTGLGNGLWQGLAAGEWINGNEGLVWFPGRLTNLGTGAQTLDLNHSGVVSTIDNTPLWKYIKYGHTPGTDVPLSCLRETFESMSIDDANANIETCVTDYKAADYIDAEGEVANPYVPLLTEDSDGDGRFDIEDSPRFAIVPQTAEEELPRGRKVVTIAGFKAVWVQGLYFPGGDPDDDDGDGETVLIVEPGETNNPVTVPNGTSPLDQVTGWLLPDSTVEAVIGLTDEAGGEVGGGNVIELIG